MVIFYLYKICLFVSPGSSSMNYRIVVYKTCKTARCEVRGSTLSMRTELCECTDRKILNELQVVRIDPLFQREQYIP